MPSWIKGMILKNDEDVPGRHISKTNECDPGLCL